MSCRCQLCSSLGAVEDEKTANTSSSRQQIENHHEIHRRQLKFIEDISEDSTIGDNGSSKEGNTASSKKSEEHIQSETKGGCSKNGEDGRQLEPERKESMPMAKAEKAKADSSNKSNTARKSIINTTKVSTTVKSEEPNGAEMQQSENSERESIYAHCRSILPRRQYASSMVAHCSLCNAEKSVYFHTGIVSRRNVLRHILSHLGRTIYSCRHCVFRSNGIESHLRTVHGIKNPAGHFEDNIGQYADEIKDLITKCFEKQGDSNVTVGSSILPRGGTKSISRTSNVRANVSKSALSTVNNGEPNSVVQTVENPKRESIFAHCRSVIPNRGPNSGTFARCNLCNVGKSVYWSTGTVRYHDVFRHVLSHLRRAIYSCDHCELRSNRIDRIKKHLNNVHHITSTNSEAHFEDSTGQYVNEIKDMITKCFGNQDNSKWTVESSELRRGGGSIKLTIRKVKIGSKLATAGSSSKVGTNRSSNGIRNRKMVNKKSGVRRSTRTDNKLAKTRRAVCRRFIRDAGNPDRIRCQKCGDDVPIMFNSIRAIGATYLLKHIQMAKHLAKAMYRCRLCQADCISYSMLTWHFTNNHRGVSLSKNYVSREDDYHEEIMRELSACFGADGFKDGVDTNGGGGSSRKAKAHQNRKKTESSVGESPNRKVIGQDEQAKRRRLDNTTVESARKNGTNSTSAQDDNGNQDVGQIAHWSGCQMHRCPVCNRSFAYHLVLEKHIDVFHSGK